MAGPKKGSTFKRFLSGIGLIKDDKSKVKKKYGVLVLDRESQSQSAPPPVRKTSVPEEVRKRASSASEAVQQVLENARVSVTGKWTELRAKYSKDMPLSEITQFIIDNPEQAKIFIKKDRPTGVFSKREFLKENS